MNYKINPNILNSGNYVEDIFLSRGIDNILEYLTPTKKDLLPPTDLKNIDEGAKLLLNHLKNKSKIYVVVD